MKALLGHLYTVSLAVALVLGTGASAGSDDGPLQTTNRFPLHMLVLTPRPTNAELPGKAILETTFALEYSSTYFENSNSRWNFLLDMEMLVGDITMAYGVSEKLALRLDIPLISMQDGFLDGFLQNYHDFLGVPNYGRENRPGDAYAYRVTKDDRIWLLGKKDRLRLGDVRLSMQIALSPLALSGHSLNSAVLVTLKLPTGDAGSGTGSGRSDAGLFVPMQWCGARWSFYLMPGAIWVNDPQTVDAAVSARNSISLFTGAAYRCNHRWRWLAQVNCYSSPFEASGLNALDRGAMELSIGFQRTLSRSLYWEFAFCEDLSRAVPDFNIRSGLTWRFGNRPARGKGDVQ